MSERLPTYGGQAVIEGVMMRGSKAVAMAMRAPDGSIKTHTERLTGIYTSRLAKIPFLRGLVVLWDSLGLGMRFLTIAANAQTGDNEKLEGPALWGTMALSFALGIGLFFLAPALVGQLGEHFLGINAWWSNVIEGLIRLALMILYIWGIGQMKDVAAVFAYHGAEHKTINAFEARARLIPELVISYSVEHPRCGTAFLLTVVLMSIVLFSLLGPLPIFWRLASRVLLLPLLAGLAYEYIRWTANHLTSPIVKLLIKPSLALQHLTTREPNLAQVEVAIEAFTIMLEHEKAALKEAHEDAMLTSLEEASEPAA